MPEATKELEARVRDMVVEFGLRRLEACTDTHVVTVREPSFFEEAFPHLVTEVKEIDY